MSKLATINFDTAEPVSKIKQLQYYRLTLCDVLISYFKRHESHTWRAIRFIEFTPLFLLKRRKVQGTVFEPFADLLMHHAHPMDGTIGNVMHALGLDKQHVHHIACHCLGAEVSGSDVARRLDHYAQYNLRF